MSVIETISVDLQAMGTGIGRAQESTAAADHAARQIAERAAGTGFVGIAQHLARVRTAITEIHARVAAVGGSIDDTRSRVATAPTQMSPEQSIAVLTPAHENLTTIHGGIGAAIAKVTEVQQLTAAVLQGGQPGPMLSRLDVIKQVLLAVAQRSNAAKQHVEAALAEARRTGDAGNP